MVADNLKPFQTWYDLDRGSDLPLPPELSSIYGRIQVPPHRGRPYVISNFVETIDGVATLNIPGHSGGEDISGHNPYDRLLMGLLRAAADVIIVGSSQLREPPGTIWTPSTIFPQFARFYDQFRQNLGKSGNPSQVVVTGNGKIDPDLPIFQNNEAPVLILTTAQGAEELQRKNLPSQVQIVKTSAVDHLGARQILDEVNRIHPGELYLVEGGPHLIRYFFKERCLDELYLTLAPQIAGRDRSIERIGIVDGELFAPDNPRWGTLVGIKQAGSHLFLRYAFEFAV